jgi:sugar phosphate permease
MSRTRPTDDQRAFARRTLTYRWVCFGLLFVCGFLAFFTRLAPAVAAPDLRAAFDMNAAQLGLLTSLYLWPFAILQPFVGLLTDAIGARRTVTLFLLIAGLGQLLFAMAPTLPLASLGRVLTGVGMSTLYVSAAAVMAEWFRRSEFGTLTGLWTSVANLGGLSAAAPLAGLIAIAGWRSSFFAMGLAALGAALLVHRFVRDSPSAHGLPSIAEIDGEPPGTATATMPFRDAVHIVLRTPNTWLLGGYAFLLFGTMTMMQGLWAVPYLMEVYGHTQQEAANRLTVWAVGLIVGCTLWGYVADRVVRTRKGVVLVGAVLYGLLWLMLAVRPSGLPDGLVWIAMFWGGFFASTWIPVYAQLKDAVPAQAVATAMGILNLCFWLGGAVYQQVSGIVLASLSPGGEPTTATGYHTVFALCLGSVVLSVVLVGCSRESAV